MNLLPGVPMSSKTPAAVATHEQIHVVFTPDHEDKADGLKVDISEWLNTADVQTLSMFWTHREVWNKDFIGQVLEWYYVDKNEELKKLVAHCERLNREVMPFGYICSFDAESIKAWILEHRTDLGSSLVCLRNAVIVNKMGSVNSTAKEKSFFWYELNGDTRSAEKFESALDAANNAIAVLNLA